MTASILVPSTIGLSAGHLLDAALSASRKFNADIHEMFVRPDPLTVLGYLPDVIAAAGVTLDVIEKETTAAATAAESDFDDWKKRHVHTSAGSPVRTSARWSSRIGELETLVTRFGRISDLIVVHSPISASTQSQRCFDAAVFGSGRPTLVVGEDALFHDLSEHILIAWNGSQEASRAVAGALPLLQSARRISILTAAEYDRDDVDLEDLAEAFVHRGLTTPQIVFPERQHSVGGELVAAATKCKVTLIVMGAYTHSRMRQSFLGGVTRHLLAHAPTPLLMCH